MYSKSKALARFLRNRARLKTGNTVAVVLPNVPEYAIIVLGSSEAGLQITTVNPAYTPGITTIQVIGLFVHLLVCSRRNHQTVQEFATSTNIYPNRTMGYNKTFFKATSRRPHSCSDPKTQSKPATFDP